MRLSQNSSLLKIIIAPSDSYRNLKGVLIFSDFHPIGRGKEGGENHKMNVLRQSDIRFGVSIRDKIFSSLPALFRQFPKKFKEGFVKFMATVNGVGKHKYAFAVYKLHLIF